MTKNIESLHERSCVLDSFAFIMGLRPGFVSRMVGHDGQQGYHTQELIDIACSRGFTVTEIQRKPVGQNPLTGITWLVTFREDIDVRFGNHMCSEEGVLLGRTPFTHKPHCVAWSDPYAYDPAIDQRYEILDGSNKPTDTNFIPMVFLRMKRL